MNTFDADDGEPIHLRIEGQGPPVVLLHGWTASHDEWTPFVPELARRHRVYRWDARGHGGHALTTASPPTVQRMARDLRNLLDCHGLRGVVLVGHSMGALTIWEYLREHGTASIDKLCFIDQSPKLLTDGDWAGGIYGDFDRLRAAQFAEDMRADFAEAVLRLTARGLNDRARAKYEANSPGWQRVREGLRALHPPPLIETWSSLTAADYRDVLQTIDVPVLLIHGGQSNFYGRDTARFVGDRIRQAVLHIYEDADHSPHQWQRERFVRDLLDFIGG